MVEHSRLVEESKGKGVSDQHVWRVVQRQLEYTEANPQSALYDDLVASFPHFMP
jgi:hypothetical protein